MSKKINNKNIDINKIFRFPASNQSRLYKIRIDKNERANTHKKFFLKYLKKEINSDLISAYPEFNKIYKKLAKKLKVSSKNIVFTAGSDQAIKNTFELFYKKNKNVITIDPTFAMVDIYSKIFKTKQIKIGFNKKLELNTEDLFYHINKKTSLIIIANPNSPTGSLLDKEVLIKIIKRAKKYNIKVLVDEAYYEFSKYNLLSQIKKFNNLIIVRTFSKIFGFAGLRCGYVVSNNYNIKKYFAIKPMYEINSIAVKALEMVLDNPNFTKSYLREMREGEKYAQKFCKKHKYDFIKCYANFFHINFNFDPIKIQKYLNKRNILVKGGPGVASYEKYLRISFANKKTISYVLEEIKNYLSLKG